MRLRPRTALLGGVHGLRRGVLPVIRGYVGLPGTGKTYLAVAEAVALARRRGAILASNILVDAPGVEFVRLVVGDDGLGGLPELVDRSRAEGRGVVLLIDEVGIILPARFWQVGMSIDLMWSVSQSRKLRADLIYTAQDVEQVDAFLRRLTSWVTLCRAVPASTVERIERGKRPWFIWQSRWSPGGVGKDGKRLGWSLTWYRRAWEALYSTDELVRPPAHLRGGRSRPRAEDRSGPRRPPEPVGPRLSAEGAPAPL